MRPFKTRPEGPDSRERQASANHIVHFYDEQDALLQSAASFLAGGLLRGAPALVLIMPNRMAALTEQLRVMGVDIERATAARQLILLDSVQLVERFLVDGMPDEGLFREVIAEQVTSLIEIWRPFQLFAFGDMVDVLYTRGDADAAVELERLWDGLAHRHGFALYCAYDARQFAHDDHRAAFDAICRHHSMILPRPAERPLAEQAPLP